jgi:hypothetical protein
MATGLGTNNRAQLASDRHRWDTRPRNSMEDAMTGQQWVTFGLLSHKIVTGLDGSAFIWDRFGGHDRDPASVDSRQKPTQQAGDALHVVPANRF